MIELDLKLLLLLLSNILVIFCLYAHNGGIRRRDWTLLHLVLFTIITLPTWFVMAVIVYLMIGG